MMGEKSTKLTETKELFECIRDFKVQSLSSGEWANLSTEQQRYVNKVIDSY